MMASTSSASWRQTLPKSTEALLTEVRLLIELSRVADGGGTREAGNFLVGDARGLLQFVGEGTEAGAKNQRDFRTQPRLREDEFRGAIGAREFGVAR